MGHVLQLRRQVTHGTRWVIIKNYLHAYLDNLFRRKEMVNSGSVKQYLGIVLRMFKNNTFIHSLIFEFITF